MRGRGIEPTIVEYLKTPPDAAELGRILGLLGMTPRQLLRKREAAEVGLDDPALTDEALVAGMAANPNTIERPILATDPARSWAGRRKRFWRFYDDIPLV